ncbi:hypothetical protein XENOCAPTIV_017517 [Xenoophorus captivus]|uniref:Cystatin domain-containing protein n=1 Tax=Xenoophorus captivus TaxID=1517983 RepID=A0ABV0SI89_9TELE
MPGSPSNISRNDASLQQVVLNAAHSFNNQSNDAFLFKPSAIHRAQRQVVKGIRYIVDFQISRTVCHKWDHIKDLSKCDLQPSGRLHQVSFQVRTGCGPDGLREICGLHRTFQVFSSAHMMHRAQKILFKEISANKSMCDSSIKLVSSCFPVRNQNIHSSAEK